MIEMKSVVLLMLRNIGTSFTITNGHTASISAETFTHFQLERTTHGTNGCTKEERDAMSFHQHRKSIIRRSNKKLESALKSIEDVKSPHTQYCNPLKDRLTVQSYT